MAVATSTIPGPVMEFLGRVAYEAHLMQPLLPTYLHLLVSAIFPIYVAAHASLARPPSAKRAPKNKGSQSDDTDETSQKIETLSPSDAILFPVLAGCTLASLYFILKYLQDPAWLNWALGIYFSQIGFFFATKFIKDMLVFFRSVTLPTEYSAAGQIWQVDLASSSFQSPAGHKSTSPLPGFLRHLPVPSTISTAIWTIRRLLYTKANLNLHIHRLLTVKTLVTLLDLFAIVISASIVAYHTFVSKPWFLTNFLGFSFCYGSLQYISPTTGWTATLILGALFFYDIYFVFFTPMMITVATKLDVPIKLLFPRPDGCIMPVGALEGSVAMEKYLQCVAKKRTMAMLGLGDIVIPGMVLAFALRFDLYLYYLRQNSPKSSRSETVVKKRDARKPTYLPATGRWGERFWTKSSLQSSELRAKKFPKTYFYSTVFGYLAGMITTVIVMQIAAHAQPALLYLVPGVLVSLWGTALVKGDLKTLWHYTEMSEEGKEDDKKQRDTEKEDQVGEKITEAAPAIKVEGSEEEFDDNGAKDAETPRLGFSSNQEVEINEKASKISSKSRKPGKSLKEPKEPKDAEKNCRRLFSLVIKLQDSSSKQSPSASPEREVRVTSTFENADTPSFDDTGSDADEASTPVSSSSSSPSPSPNATPSPTSTTKYNLRNRGRNTKAVPNESTSLLSDVRANHEASANFESEAHEAVKGGLRSTRKDRDLDRDAAHAFNGEPPGKRRRRS